VDPWWLTSHSPSGYFYLLAKYEFLGIPGVAGLQKYCILMASRFLTPAVNSPVIIKHAKMEEIT
jgi:hypothetical protein